MTLPTTNEQPDYAKEVAATLRAQTINACLKALDPSQMESSFLRRTLLECSRLTRESIEAMPYGTFSDEKETG